MADTAMLLAANLTRRFGDRVAVDDVSFRVAQGETYGLLGPNGAGKTTTIRLVCGLLSADSGEVTVAGMPVSASAPKAKAQIGYVPQDVSLCPGRGLGAHALGSRAGPSLLTGAISARRRATVLTRPSQPRHWAGLAVVGVFGGAVAFLLFFEGLARASATDAAFLHKTLLVWVALLALPLLGERLGAMHVAAIALLVVGQIGLAGGATTVFGQGQLMVLGATLLWAGEVVVAKRLLADLSSWTVGLTRMGVGSAVLITWTLIRGEGGALTALTSEQWMWVLLTGVILAGYVSTWFAALSRAPAVDVTAVLVVGAVVTALLAAGVKGTPLVPQLGWLALVLAGASLAALPRRGGADALPGVR